MMKNVFYFMSKLFSFLRYLHFCSDFLVIKRLDEKTKVNFKFYDVTDWTGNSSKIPIALYLKKERQSGNETQENVTSEIFFYKYHAENETGRQVPDLFLIFKKVYRR